MVICFTVDAGAKIALDNLVNSGMYKDMSEAICVSLINHDIIQREAQHNGTLQITRADLLDERSSFVQGSGLERPHVIASDATARKRSIPDIFRLPHANVAADEFPVVADDIDADSLTSPKQWLFGQYNKLLPIKATLRALVNLCSRDRHGVPITEAVRKISSEALMLGDYLEELDARRGASRENGLATAFPTASGSGSPGQSRFANQFVVSVSADGTATGFPIALRLAGYSNGKTPRLNLSRQGAAFALLENPVLDRTLGAEQDKFSSAELSFLISHILTYVPEERVAFKIVLGALSKGATTPKALDAFLYKNNGDRSMTAAFLSLQRSGVIARLVDLQLVERARDGTRVNYVITESGKDTLAKLSADKAEPSRRSR